MPPSQLKQLKASLRDHGLVGPQKSKKQKKAASKDGNKRLQRNAALAGIRERFNPFEVKAPARRDKFEVTSNKVTKNGPGRPGVTKGLGEERRKATLLKEIQSRNRVGGILDRRFGENDPTMTPEQRAAERFARQNMRKAKKNSMFNLEDDEEGGVELTHGGRSLLLDDEVDGDDFMEEVEGSSNESEAEEVGDIDDRPPKRLRLTNDERSGEEGAAAEEVRERKKTKQDVMKEVIAKSKLYKYERQQAKEDDDDLRAELDKGMSDLFDALKGQNLVSRPPPTPPSTDSEPSMNPDRAAMLAGKDPKEIEKEYDRRMREMKLDRRSNPTERTKTEDEKAVEEVERLRELERKRIRRMKGEPESSDDELEEQPIPDADQDDYPDDAEAFGLAQSAAPQARRELEVEDEDEFILNDELVASDSGADLASDSESQSEDESVDDDGDDDFINGLVLPPKSSDRDQFEHSRKPDGSLAFTFPCPESHTELLKITRDTKIQDVPTVVQRIRALHHAGLAEGNKAKLARFAAVLAEHIAYLANLPGTPSSILESLLRHLHSMAKSQPDAVGLAFRDQLRQIANVRPLALTAGDMLLLTGVSIIFPTSDHFHPVATPAMLTIARYLGQSSVQSLQDLAVGVYCCTLALQYQRVAKRYVPEVMTYLTNAVAILAPGPIPAAVLDSAKWTVPIRLPSKSLIITELCEEPIEQMRFGELFSIDGDLRLTQVRLLSAVAKLLCHAGELWKDKSAFFEMFDPPFLALTHCLSKSSRPLLSKPLRDIIKSALSTLTVFRSSSAATRKPLLLHHHRPLAIKQSIPKFEEGFNPDRHYDPDQERSQLNKLKAEHKRERKGAMRELRKDANFIAREQLKEKKQRDEAYEKKFKRLVAEIQGEEGKESKEYEREKLKRKGRW